MHFDGHPRRVATLLLCVGLVACGGGAGGSDSAANVQPGPPPPGTNAPPPQTPPGPPTPGISIPYRDAATLSATITAAAIGPDTHPVVDFDLRDGANTAVVDLTAADVRFIVAKHQAAALGTFQGTWQSYINRVEQPGVGPGTTAKLQATLERGRSGTFTNNGDGTYRYRFDAALDSPDPAIAAQADSEGLDLSYQPTLTHRISIQFDNAKVPLNPSYDFEPASGATTGIVRGLIVATVNCNSCHGGLAVHGGARVETDYCATCHNPGTSDANSGNNLDFAEITHKIHMGANLPSVSAGGSYVIYGFNDMLNDYSGVQYPQDIRHCAQCHAGSATDDDSSTPTAQGDNWSEFPTRRACGSCHDDVDFSNHYGDQTNDSACRSCHAFGGAAGSVPASHQIRQQAAAQRFAFEIVDTAATTPGAVPQIDFRVIDPSAGGTAYDILHDAAFAPAVGARLAVTLAWPTRDFTNTRPDAEDAGSISIDALAAAIPLGNGTFRVISGEPLPDGATAPFVAATGSGAVTIEGHPSLDVDPAMPGAETIPVPNALRFFAIDDTTPLARRQIVDIGRCNACHGVLSVHGGNRTASIDGCATCHNPRNTDRGVRETAVTAPTDGKQEESLDFKTMIHALHAATMRERPLQIVGFRGLTTYVYDVAHVHYPRRLADCAACHRPNSFTLPLTAGVLGTTVDTGMDRADPHDDVVASPLGAVCAACHDSAAARSHMQGYGADFATSQAALDNGAVSEAACAGCHGPGESDDIASVHAVP
jgi:OmcA/MtrC family decaheme c-type cytochrome